MYKLINAELPKKHSLCFQLQCLTYLPSRPAYSPFQSISCWYVVQSSATGPKKNPVMKPSTSQLWKPWNAMESYRNSRHLHQHRPRPMAVPPIVCVAPPRLLGSPTPLHPSWSSKDGTGLPGPWSLLFRNNQTSEMDPAFPPSSQPNKIQTTSAASTAPRVNFHGAPLHGATAPWRNRALLLNPFDGRKPFGTKNWQDPCKIHEAIWIRWFVITVRFSVRSKNFYSKGSMPNLFSSLIFLGRGFTTRRTVRTWQHWSNIQLPQN